ncbi:MAG: FtsL-like putative cell division protein [Bacteroidota bacterium]
MAKNEFKPLEVEEPVVEKANPKPKKVKESRLGISLRTILDGSILTRDAVVRLLPFGIYMAFLIVAYIGNSYYSEKIIRKTSKVRNELKELEYEYISTKSDLMDVSKQSEVAIRLDSLKTGLKESLVPPIKIFENVQSKAKSK